MLSHKKNNSHEEDTTSVTVSSSASNQYSTDCEDGKYRTASKKHYRQSPDIQRNIIQRLTQPLIGFWYHDLPPLYGPLRFAFYGIYWYITLRNQDFWFHSYATRETFLQQSCMKHLSTSIPHFWNLGVQYKTEGGLFNKLFLSTNNNDRPPLILRLPPALTCGMLSYMFWYGLVFSAIGFGGKIPRITTAISFWILFGIRTSRFLGESSHAHYLAGMACIALCFAENNTAVDSWSVDAFIVWCRRKYHQRKSRRPQQSNGSDDSPERETSPRRIVLASPSAGSAARKFVLYMCVCSIFFAGMHKFSTFGFRWMDGATILNSANRQRHHWDSLHDIFTSHPFLSLLLGTSTIIGEIGAFAVLLYPSWRPYGILTFYAFHLGVFFLMHPNFISNMVTYILIMDWRRVFQSIKHVICRSRDNNTKREKLIDNQRNDTQDKDESSTMSYSNYPISWKLGAWIYSMVAAIVFITSLCRIDYFPFSSWSLYNWHPTEIGNQAPFTEKTVKLAAHRCLTKPPFNPACRNHGNSGHHDRLSRSIDYYLKTVTIVKDTKRRRLKTKSGKDLPAFASCPLAIYINWKPIACEKSDETIPPTQQYMNMMAAATASSYYSKKDRDKITVPPTLPAYSVRRTLRRHVVDAVAATIEDGTQCFDDNSYHNNITQQWKRVYDDVWWKQDINRKNAVARYLRQLRLYMNDPADAGMYILEGQSIVSMAVSFEYLRDPKENIIPFESAFNYTKQAELPEDIWNICMMGKTYSNENITTYGNFEIGVTQPTSKFPRGDWSEVWNEVFLIGLLGLSIIYVPKLAQFDSLHNYHQNEKDDIIISLILKHWWEMPASRRRTLIYLFPLMILTFSQIIWSTVWASKTILRRTEEFDSNYS